MGIFLLYVNVILDLYVIASYAVERYCLKRGMRDGYAKWIPPVLAVLWGLILLMNVSSLTTGNTKGAGLRVLIAAALIATRIWTTDIYCYRFLKDRKEQKQNQPHNY